ncbi:MAG: PPC domain-containing protein [Candidatus Hodarchaeota archaeon]
MMQKGFNGRTKIMVVTLAVLTLIGLVPAVSAYGSSKTTAETITAGTTYDTWYGDYYGWYKIQCSVGAQLSVDFTAGQNIWGDLYIKDSNSVVLDSDTDPGYQTDTYGVSASIPRSGWYYIEIERDSTATISITLVVTLTGGVSVPGYPIIAMLLGICAGITILLARKYFQGRKIKH